MPAGNSGKRHDMQPEFYHEKNMLSCLSADFCKNQSVLLK